MTVSAKMTTDYSIDGAMAHPAITHCDNCGFDWLDNGLNPVGCPYCKQPVGMEGFRTAVEEARRVWMDENPCEDGHDHVTPFDQFLYGPLAQQPAADKFAATFRCESNGIVGYVDAPIHSINMHDDGVVEVVIDYWPEQLSDGDATRWIKENGNG